MYRLHWQNQVLLHFIDCPLVCARILSNGQEMKALHVNDLDRGQCFCIVPQGAAAPMFPTEDDENEYDDYGALLGPDEFHQTDYDGGGALLPVACPPYLPVLC